MSLLSSFLIWSLISVGFSYLKLYPLFFLLFVFLYCFQEGSFDKKLGFFICLFLGFASFFCVFNLPKSFDLISFLKLLINVIYFLCVSSYVRRKNILHVVSLFSCAASVFIVLSFFQTFYIVQALSLWSLPFSLADSTSSYVIQNRTIFFGDLNKNIWASKVCIFLMIYLLCLYVNKRFSIGAMLVFFLGFLNLLYVSSRTAQLALLMFFASLLIYHYWFVNKKRTLLVILVILCIPVFLYALQRIVRTDFSAIFNFDPGAQNHMGDGLLARFIIWNYILNIVSFDQWLTGSGILSFSYLTGNIFPENNPHNVFLSIGLDFGLLTLLAYLCMLAYLFTRSTLSLVLLIPFMVFANSQYLGYDSDLVVLFNFIFVLGKLKSRHVMKLVKFRSSQTSVSVEVK